MTPEQIAQHRKEYEQFAADEGRDPVESEWRIWMESRARLTIAAPEPAPEPCIPLDERRDNWSTGFNDGLAAFQQRIHRVGIRVALP